MFLAILLGVLLSACSGAETPPFIPPPLPTTTATRIPDTPIPPTASPTTTETPVSDTPVPTPALPTLVLLGDYPRLSPEDLLYDLDELFHRLETTHPDPYARRSKAEVDQERQRLEDELTKTMTLLDFYRRVAPLVNGLGDYHTTVSLPNNLMSSIIAVERFFPFIVQRSGEQSYVIANLSGNPELISGSELLEVNGVPSPALYQAAEKYSPLARYLSPWEFWLLFGSLSEYQVKARLPGETAPVTLTIPGLTFAEANEQAAVGLAGDPPPELVIYTRLPDEPIGVLTINGFTGIGPLLKTPFTQIQADGIEHLILDVRANAGGYVQDVDTLMDYIASQSYRICSRSYKAPFGGYGTGNPREIECELQEPFDVSQRYTGKLYLLIGPDTFSAAMMFAMILQDYDLALLIGEETRDSASFCANVTSEMLPLPRTGLLYLCSRECFVRPSGVVDDRGVVPDILVETTIEDQIAGIDPVLNYTLELIRSGQAP